MSDVLNTQFFTLPDVAAFDEWKTFVFGNDAEYERWNTIVYSSCALFIESFLISKVTTKDGYTVDMGYAAYEPLSNEHPFCIVRFTAFVPHGQTFDDHGIKRELLRFINAQFGILFVRDENGKWDVVCAA